MKERYINFILFVIVLIVIILFGYTYLSYKNQDVSIASVQIDAKSFGLKVNESRQIEYMYLPEKASGEIRFRSSNEEVIEVNSITGYVTAKRVGSAIIEIIDANEEVLQFFEVYGLKQKVEIIEVGVEEEIKIANGKSYLMTKKPIPSNAVLPELKYVSSDENIVKVENNGKITGVGVGNAYIEIRSKDGKLEEKVLVSVGQSEEYTQEENTDYTIDVEKIELEKETIKIKEGEIYQIEAKVKPENATNKELSYTSLDNKIVEILENGVIKGKSKGKTAIEIRSVNNKVKRVEVEVKEETKEEVKEEIKAAGIEIEVKKISIVQGEKREINARIIPTNAENKKLTWTSSNKKVVEVENGIIEGKNIGKSTITIKTTNGIKREIEVEVVKKKIEVLDIGVNLEEVKIGIGGTATILTVVSPIDATNKTLKWESTNSSVATVNQEGFIKGISAGSCKIVVKANNGIQKEISVKVEKIEVQRLELSKEEISIKVGGTEKIT